MGYRHPVESRDGVWLNPAGVLSTCRLMGFDPEIATHPLDLSRVLMVDFDGVFHQEGCGMEREFGLMPNFERALEACDPSGQVTIVVSSAWRFSEELCALRRHFPDSIARQVVGVTPELPPPNDAGWPAGGAARIGQREAEIEAWMQEFSPAGEWLAIDDRAPLFRPACASLFLVGRDGLCRDTAERFQARLESWGAPSHCRQHRA